jgi:hypothetical protein
MTAQTRLESGPFKKDHTSINGEASKESVLLISTPKLETSLGISCESWAEVRLDGLEVSSATRLAQLDKVYRGIACKVCLALGEALLDDAPLGRVIVGEHRHPSPGPTATNERRRGCFLEKRADRPVSGSLK